MCRGRMGIPNHVEVFIYSMNMLNTCKDAGMCRESTIGSMKETLRAVVASANSCLTCYYYNTYW